MMTQTWQRLERLERGESVKGEGAKPHNLGNPHRRAEDREGESGQEWEVPESVAFLFFRR